MHGPTFQRFVEDGCELSALPQQQPSASSDEESSDGDADTGDAAAAQPAVLRLGFRPGAGRSQSSSRYKSSSSSSSPLLPSPRTIAELGVLEPDAIIRNGSTFATADHCILAAKELSVRVQADRVSVLRRQTSGHNYVKCTCTGLGCNFSMLATPKQQDDGFGLTWVVKEYAGHNCRDAASAAASESNDARPKQVSAALRAPACCVRQS